MKEHAKSTQMQTGSGARREALQAAATRLKGRGFHTAANVSDTPN
jgi:hypothetical protein